MEDPELIEEHSTKDEELVVFDTRSRAPTESMFYSNRQSFDRKIYTRHASSETIQERTVTASFNNPATSLSSSMQELSFKLPTNR